MLSICTLQAELEDELSIVLPPQIRAGLLLGRCHAVLGQHALSSAAFESAERLSRKGRYFISTAVAVRERALTGETLEGAGGHWDEATGRARLEEALGQAPHGKVEALAEALRM